MFFTLKNYRYQINKVFILKNLLLLILQCHQSVVVVSYLFFSYFKQLYKLQIDLECSVYRTLSNPTGSFAKHLL